MSAACRFAKPLAAACVVGALLAIVSACQKPEGPAEHAGKQLDKAAEQTGQQIEKAGQAIKDAVK